MSKITGKDLEFWWDGNEYPVISAELSEEFDSLDVTDTSTPGDGKDTAVGRANRKMTIDMFLYSPDGAIFGKSDPLIANKKYRVVQVQESGVLSHLEVGQLFVFPTAQYLGEGDKGQGLGEPMMGKNMSFTFGSESVPCTDIDLSINYDTQDATDTSTEGDSGETIVGRAETESKITLIARSNQADLLTTNPIVQNAELRIKSSSEPSSEDTVISGQVIPVSKTITDEATGFAKVDYSFKWQGTPTEQNAGLPTNVQKPFKIILKRGSSTHKSYTGNAVITSKKISGSVKDLVKVSLTLQINGSLTYAVANERH